MLNKRTSGQLSPCPLARLASQIPLSGGTTPPEYLYCTANIGHPADICKMLNIYYYGVFLIR